MSSDTSTCPGCDKTFSVRGYESHLTQSQDPLCRAVYEELRMAHTLYERLKKFHSADHGSDSDAEAHTFQGDAFGSPEDYATDTFGQDADMPAEDPPTNVEDDEPPLSDDFDEEDENMAELEHTWEPPHDGAPAEEIEEVEGNDINTQEELHEDSDIGSRRAAERVLIGEGHGVKPVVVLRYMDKYPSSAAGGILARGETGDKSYRAAVSGQEKSPSPWAPFRSRKDWEVALWAKLRGPGSTAFSDLLAIPGVRFILIHQV